jgi:hypothetical protein
MEGLGGHLWMECAAGGRGWEAGGGKGVGWGLPCDLKEDSCVPSALCRVPVAEDVSSAQAVEEGVARGKSSC